MDNSRPISERVVLVTDDRVMVAMDGMIIIISGGFLQKGFERAVLDPPIEIKISGLNLSMISSPAPANPQEIPGSVPERL